MLPIAAVNEVLHLNSSLHLEYFKQFHLVQCVSSCMSVHEIVINHLHSQVDITTYTYSVSQKK